MLGTLLGYDVAVRPPHHLFAILIGIWTAFFTFFRFVFLRYIVRPLFLTATVDRMFESEIDKVSKKNSSLPSVRSRTLSDLEREVEDDSAKRVFLDAVLMRIWNFDQRIVASFHAIGCAVFNLYLFLDLPELHNDWSFSHYDERFITVQCFSVGYFIFDLIFVLWWESEFWMFLMHHVVAGVSVSLSLYAESFQLGFLLTGLTEFTTPFINNIFLLKDFGLGDHPIFIVNGIAILVLWIVFRFGSGFFALSYTIYVNRVWYFQQPIGYVLWFGLMQFSLFAMNVIWFVKIVQGFVRIVFGSSSGKKQENKRKKEG